MSDIIIFQRSNLYDNLFIVQGFIYLQTTTTDCFNLLINQAASKNISDFVNYLFILSLSLYLYNVDLTCVVNYAFRKFQIATTKISAR